MRRSTIGVVAIGRNEGQRLVACLCSLKGKADRIIYVDSGSSDHSVAHARAAGVEVIELGAESPFTAARGRNAGFAHLKASGMTDFVQFVDGDCIVDSEWLTHAAQALEQDSSLGLVTGWRRERFPQASIFNDLCHHEWNRPAGVIKACGGDMMLRPKAFEDAGKFDETVIAAEDDEFCITLAKAGWGLERIPFEMTYHDAAMTRFRQWWRRAVRSGHGFAQVGDLHPPYFRTEQKRALFYAGLLPLLALLALLVWPWGLALVFAVYLASFFKTVKGLRAAGLKKYQSRRHAVFLVLSKFPNLVGMAIYQWRCLRLRNMQIIEYK